MGKGRTKKKAKQNATSKTLQSANINLPENMSEEKFQHIIACAIVEAEELKEKKSKTVEEQKRLEWQKSIGYKDFSYINCKLWKIIRNFFNRVYIFFNIIFMKKEKISGNSASAAFLQEILIVFFAVLQILSLLFSICCIVAILCPQFLPITSSEIYLKILCYIFAPISFLLSCVFRLIRLEIDNLDDRNYLFGLFASITSLVSIVVAVIAVVKGA